MCKKAPHAANLSYNDLRLDRAPAARQDAAFLSKVRARPQSRVIPFWRGACFLETTGTLLELSMADYDRLLAAGDELVLLGFEGADGVFAADFANQDKRAIMRALKAAGMAEVRDLVDELRPSKVAELAYAKGLLFWHAKQHHCGTCGGLTYSTNGGAQRSCSNCGRIDFPRIEPAVIVLVEAPGDPDRCLLARHDGAEGDSFSTLAGFVEVGECLEDAVRREVAEEVGILVKNIRYRASQAWPFPAGLMMGFRATAVSETVSTRNSEIIEARWFTRAEVRDRHFAAPCERRNRFKPKLRDDSIEAFLLREWVFAETEHHLQ